MYFLCCKKNTANKNSILRKTEQNRLMLLSNCQGLLKIKNFIKSYSAVFNNI